MRQIVPTGLVSYKYSTRKGLSTKVLATFDVAMPDGARREAGGGKWELGGKEEGREAGRRRVRGGRGGEEERRGESRGELARGGLV